MRLTGIHPATMLSNKLFLVRLSPVGAGQNTARRSSSIVSVALMTPVQACGVWCHWQPVCGAEHWEKRSFLNELELGWEVRTDPMKRANMGRVGVVVVDADVDVDGYVGVARVSM